MSRRTFLAGACALVAMASPAFAANLLDTPVYDPEAKAYFEMVDGLKIYKGYQAQEGPTWAQSAEFARSRSYKGVQGRLATVKTLEVHEFLARTFQPNNYVWIGLRYWCGPRTLQWSDGEYVTAKSFQAWDKVWKQDVYACSGQQAYMPVAYQALPTFDWIGKGIDKRYYFFFVEYPTGQP